MKLVVCGMFALCLMTSFSFAQKKAKEVTITGEVIDMQCYLSGAVGKATGEAHKECATRCAQGGIPLGILETGSGAVYLAGQTKIAQAGANKMLMDYIAEEVRVTGRVFEKGGEKIVLISKVERSKPKPMEK